MGRSILMIVALAACLVAKSALGYPAAETTVDTSAILPPGDSGMTGGLLGGLGLGGLADGVLGPNGLVGGLVNTAQGAIHTVVSTTAGLINGILGGVLGGILNGVLGGGIGGETIIPNY